MKTLQRSGGFVALYLAVATLGTDQADVLAA